MAGIFNRIKPDGADRLDGHLLIAALGLFSTGAFTASQVLAGLNSKLASPLAGDEITDLVNWEAQITGTPTDKLIYVTITSAGVVNVTENGLITEATFKSKLGI